ncbi:MAG: hypothetical protein IH620_00745 [Ignavibacterium sp.]|nr:hypothetical protein [Ignavibacterium sp.]
MNAGTSGIKILLLSIILILQTQNVFAQSHYLDSYPGIPIIAHTNISANQITPENLAKMKELGVMGFYATDLSATSYSTITDSGIKVFPYQVWTADNYIVYYTDAVYTKWEAEGKGDGSNGDMELKHQNSIGEIFNEGVTSGIKTFNSTSGKLIYGPWYYQYKNYKQLSLDTTNSPIEYTANYRLKIKERNPGIPLPPNYSESIVCTIMVAVTHPVRVNKDSTLFSIELKVKDFLPPDGTGWNSWKDFTINYNLSSIKDKSEEILKEGFINDDIDTSYTTNWMQYKIEWAGSTFLDLYVDYVEISDIKGRDLRTNPDVMDKIVNLIGEYSDSSKVLGWFGLNEPTSIDNYEPFRIVESVINANSNNLHLYTTFTTGWGGIYGMPWPGAFEDNGSVYIGSEFIKRSKLPYLSINLYNYNYPITPAISPTYYLENIEYVTTENLHKLDSVDIPISYSTQSGRFYDFNSNCENEFIGSINPTSEQMLYHINLGLLYGMIELTCDPLFTLYNRDVEGRPCPDSLYRAGLINFSDNSLTPLGITWRDNVAPRMSGLLGKTLRKLTPKNQYLNHTLSSSKNFIQSIVEGSCTALGMQSGDEIYDLGFFEDDLDRDYFMLISRWYNPICSPSLTININPLSFPDNYNLKVIDLIDNTSSTITKYGHLSTAIEVGDACFLSVAPVVKYGGIIAYNDTIKTNTSLIDNMTLNDSKTIIINYEKVYTIQDTITLLGTGFITGDGYLNLNSTGEIIINDWNYSLFKSRNDNHPKLV